MEYFNDGYLLQYIKQNIPCVGIEPASNIANIAIKNIPTQMISSVMILLVIMLKIIKRLISDCK